MRRRAETDSETMTEMQKDMTVAAGIDGKNLSVKRARKLCC